MAPRDNASANSMTEHAGATFDTDNPLARPERAGDSSTPRASEPTHKLAMMHQSSRLEHMRVTAIQGWEDRAKELATKEQFVQDLKKVITDEKAALVEKAKAEAGTKGSTKGQDNPVHHSNNTLGDLDIGIALNTPKRPVSWVWALVFQLPPIEYELGVMLDPKDREVPHEVWTLSYRMWACDLCLKYSITLDNNDIILEIGAPHAVLSATAAETRIGMRMHLTRGCLPFHSDLVQYMAMNHAGLNEWDINRRRWLVRGKEDAHFSDGRLHELNESEMALLLVNHGVTVPDANAMTLEEKTEKLVILRIAWQDDMDHEKNDSIWVTSIKQRLVRYRAKKYAGIDFEMRLHAPSADKMLAFLGDNAVTTQKPIRSTEIHQLLTAVGAYRPNADDVFPKTEESDASGKTVQVCYVTKLANQCLVEPHFTLAPELGDDQKTSIRTRNAGLESVSYSELVKVHTDLKKWRDKDAGLGRKENFVGSMYKYYATHNYDELAYLRQQWGTFGMLCKSQISAYTEDGNPRDMYSLSHPDNQVHEYTIPWTWAWQPIHEIRDYFGEGSALYYAWLGHYTSSLFICMLFGCLTMGLQWHYGSVEDNPLTSAYSFYVGMWSVIFVESWHRKEEEYRFLWGETSDENDDAVRPQFVGKLITTETGREVYVHTSDIVRYVKQFASFSISWVMICITIVSALGASLIRALPHPGQPGYEGPLAARFSEGGDLFGGCVEDESYDLFDHPCGFWGQNKFTLLSSLANLVIIQSFGAIYEVFADILNRWENHRTNAEYDNALVVKNFMFQFLNNYFLLFYIAFFREYMSTTPLFLNLGFSNIRQCATSSCLPELQEQLVVVFTGKTVFKQIAHTGKPFVKRCINQRRERNERAAFEKAEEKRQLMSFDYIPQTAAERQQELDAKQAKMPAVEVEANLMIYEGTFDDFNDRVVQFGYLVLFAPAYPLAPFLAWINNILEIRFGGYKMCNGFQRPVWQQRDTIGSWLGMLSFLGFAAVITNAAMILFVGSQQANATGLDYSVDLTIKNITFYTDETKPVGTFFTRLNHAELWWKFVAVEHMIMVARVVVMQVVPRVPTWVMEAQETLIYRLAYVYLTDAQIESNNRMHMKLEKNLNSGDMRKIEHAHTEDELSSPRAETE